MAGISYFHPEFLQGSPLWVAEITDGCDILCLLTWQAAFLVSRSLGRLGLAASSVYLSEDMVRGWWDSGYVMASQRAGCRRWGKIILPLPFWVIGWNSSTPGDKRLTREKRNKTINMYTSYICGRSPGKMGSSPRWPKPPFSNHLQLKTEKMLRVGLVGGMASYGRVPGKAW